jgi:two-component system, OmpR family, copper resistance phosphate regulon response regulator CusR
MLSYARSRHHHATHAGWSPLMSRTNRSRIVIAGDDMRLLRLMQHMLGRAGYHVLPATDGEAALDLIYGYDPRLCLLDASLPLRSGWQILREVREAGRHDLKGVVMTARCVEAEIAHVRRFGAAGCLAKPFSVAELLHHVRAHTRHRPAAAA